MFADLIHQLGRARSTTDARGVGLHNTDHLVDRPLGDSAAGMNPAAGAVRGGHVRECPVIDVEEAALSPFKQHTLARLQGFVQERSRVDHV